MSLKRTGVKEKADLMSLLGNIKTKLATYRLKDYSPPKELSPATLDLEWSALLKAENARSIKINQKIREYVLLNRSLKISQELLTNLISIKETLRRRFADAANEFAMILNTVALEISDMQGDIEVGDRFISGHRYPT